MPLNLSQETAPKKEPIGRETLREKSRVGHSITDDQHDEELWGSCHYYISCMEITDLNRRWVEHCVRPDGITQQESASHCVDNDSPIVPSGRDRMFSL